MVGRTNSLSHYRITGWSFRLFAPDADVIAPPNRGSAFNSCLAMAACQHVDAMYLRSEGSIRRFDRMGHEIVIG